MSFSPLGSVPARQGKSRTGVLKACEKVCFLNLSLLRVQEACGQEKKPVSRERGGQMLCNKEAVLPQEHDPEHSPALGAVVARAGRLRAQC